MRLVGPYLNGGHRTWPSLPCGVILSALRGAGMTSDRTEVTVVLLVLAGLVRHAHSCQSRHAGWVRPLLVPPRGQDGGEVVSFLCVVRLSLMKGEVVADPGLGVRPSFLSWASVVWAFARLLYHRLLHLLTNRCLKIPRDHNPDNMYITCLPLAICNMSPHVALWT
jgi:hypothetical protein